MDATLLIVLGLGLAMSLFAVIGGLFILLPEPTLKRWLKPLVAFAAGSLLGGAFFHMLPHALSAPGAESLVMLWVVVGFAAFFALDQLLEWHHGRGRPSEHVWPLGPLLLVADGVHNLLGGLAIGAILITDVRAGFAAWIAAALHEIPIPEVKQAERLRDVGIRFVSFVLGVGLLFAAGAVGVARG